MNLKRWLRRPAKTADSSPAARGRIPVGLKFFFGACAVFLACFLVGFYLFLPTLPIQERLEREVAARTSLNLDLGGLDLLFPPGLRGTDVAIRSRTGDSALTWKFESVALRPQWSTLLGDDPALSVLTRQGTGTMAGTMHRQGSFQLELTEFPFAAPVSAVSGMTISGTAVRGSLAGAVPLRAETESRIDLALADVRISGLEGFGARDGVVPLGRVTIQGSGRGNSFKLGKIEALDGALNVTGEGTLALAAVPAQSRIALNLSLRPTASAPRDLAELLGAFGQKSQDGSIRLRLGGTLGQPSLR